MSDNNENNNPAKKKKWNPYMFNKFRGRGGGRGGQFYGRGNFRQNVPRNEPSIHKDNMQSSPNSQPSITSFFALESGPYPGWKLYFTEESYMEGSATSHKVKTTENFIKCNRNLFNTSNIEENQEFSVDLKQLTNDHDFQASWEEFDDHLRCNAEHTLNCIGLAMHQVILNELYLEATRNDENNVDMNAMNFPKIYARIINFEPVLQLKDMKTNYFGKLVSVCGTIIRVGNVKLICNWKTFECSSCHSLQCVKQPEGKYTLPTSCTSGQCRSRSFIPLLSNLYTQSINFQSVKLQEVEAKDQREEARVPRTVECELTAGMVDSCTPGDVVTISGIVKQKTGVEGYRIKKSNVFSLCIEAVSVINKKNNSTKKCTTEFNLRDYYAIKEIHSEPNLFKLLVNSLSPAIYGHELVKAGLLLCLFGGSQHHTEERADPHILVVGDPGLGKSQMLQSCANVAPRGVYVCGNTSTSAGLTVSVSRESGGDYVLEAGALVLSDQGCCCIDEFDKMTAQHNALLEAMESQTICVAKAGIVCTLPARTSILAAANPVGGHYSKAKTVSENLKMGSPLLSRFDLVFILLDQPNEQLDCLLSEHVMALHLGRKSLSSDVSTSMNSSILDRGPDVPLIQRLKCLPGENLELIPHQLLRKYIAYAKKYVKPRLGSEAAQILQQFYIKLRQEHQNMDCTPVTTRQLESLIRLTEARAKLELREEATKSDAEEVVEIMKSSMIDTFTDELGVLNFTRSQNGSGMSSRNQVKKFIGLLQKKAELLSRSVFSIQEMRDLYKTAGIRNPEFSNLLCTLNIQGIILKKGPQLYQLLSAD